MTEVLRIILGLLAVSDADAEGLRRTAPQYLTLERAREHTAAARVAGLVHGVDPDLLLATAVTESNYRQRVTFVERSGALSCGVMQASAKDRAECEQMNSSLIDGYIAGAGHLRECLDACDGNIYCALGHYAGGGRFVRNCREEPERYMRECSIPGNRIWRAKIIQRQRRRAGTS